MEFNKILVGTDGKPAKQTIAKGYNEDGSATGVETINITLGHVITTSLNFIDPKAKESLTPEVIYKRGKQTYQINMGVIPEEFSTVEGVAELKETLGKVSIFNPVILYQVAVDLEAYLATCNTVKTITK